MPRKRYSQSFVIAAAPLIAMGSTFAAIGASGQSAFSYTAIGLLAPGVVLLVIGLRRWTRN